MRGFRPSESVYTADLSLANANVVRWWFVSRVLASGNGEAPRGTVLPAFRNSERLAPRTPPEAEAQPGAPALRPSRLTAVVPDPSTRRSHCGVGSVGPTADFYGNECEHARWGTAGGWSPLRLS